jgi:4-amino-4-deoxy-L-arabinose transferase-like glycosyltransferase
VWLGCLLFDRRSALAGALVLTTTVVFVAFGRVAMSDMLLAFWTTLSMALAVSALRTPRSAWPVAALGAALGLGFLTKGPVALLLPGFGLALLLWQRRAAVRSLSGKGLGLAVLLFAVMGFGWFVVLLTRLGWDPLEYFFLHENLERFAGDTYDDGRAAWYYLVTYLAEGLPWSLVLLAALARDLRRVPQEPGRDGARLLAAWVGLMLVPLSLSRGKLDYYLLPLYPAVSLIVGRYLSRPSWSRPERVWGRVVLCAVGAGLVLLAVLPTPIPDPWLPGPAARSALWVVVAGSAVAALVSASRPTPRRVLGLLSAVPATLFVIVAAFFLPAFRSAQPNARIVEDVAREHRYRADARVVVCQGAARAQRDILFHARLPVAHRCELWSFASSRYPYMILATEAERVSLARGEGLRLIESYDYVPADALTLRGLTQFPRPLTVTLLANYETDDPVAERKRKRERKKALRLLDLAGLPHPEPE